MKPSMAKQIDYKFWYVKKEDDVHISEATVRFHEGEDREVTFLDEKNEEKTEVRYVRDKVLKGEDIPELDGKHKLDSGGKWHRVYTAEDFGVITEMDDLRLFLNKEMHKHKARPNQKDQEETKDKTKVK